MPTITFTVDGPSSNTGGTLTFRPRTSFADPETGDILTPEKSRRPVEYVCNTPATVELPDGPWEVGGLEHNRLFPIDVSADALLKDLIVFGLPTTAPVTTLSQAVTVWLDANVNTEVTDTLIAGAVTTPGSEAKTALDAAYAPVFPDTGITYDGSGNVQTVTENGVTTTYTYNPDGTVATDTRDGVTRTYGYDGNGNLTSITVED
ncbi:hypothetical protein SEA_MARTEENA_29 [Gordonia phage Marteena]|nr:minor tail protein [Gordonia phage EMsquaredA]QDP45114.1 hypothetical protein SEA_MARTEENA_29 [Gordonia phage Marteena]